MPHLPCAEFPFWLSPRQICIVPVAQTHIGYAREVGALLEAEGFFVDVEDSTKTMNKKSERGEGGEGLLWLSRAPLTHSPPLARRTVRDAQLAQYNFVLVVGSDEAADRAVNVRTRANEVLGKKSLVDALAYFKQLVAEFK